MPTLTTRTQTFPVDGMSCASCALSVEDTLKKSAGVKSASVNFANKQATIEYDAAATSIEILHKSVEAAGYDLIIHSTKTLQDTGDELQQSTIKKLKAQTIGALALSIPVAIIGMFLCICPMQIT